MTKVGGIILCGGQSKRMGQPKAWLPFGQELMLQRVVRILATAVQPVVVVAAPDQAVPKLPPGVALVRDLKPGCGPLEGLSAGLSALATTCDAAYLSSCDVPLLRPSFVSRMVELLGHHAVCVPRVDDFYHPLAAIYRMEVQDVVLKLLASNRLRPVFLFDEVSTRIVEAHELADVDEALQSLRNLNTPEDYQAALREANLTPGETGDPDRAG
jgi:molybdenum cofactor guanylyltransferase